MIQDPAAAVLPDVPASSVARHAVQQPATGNVAGSVASTTWRTAAIAQGVK
jgi:hypothetical protein